MIVGGRVDTVGSKNYVIVAYLRRGEGTLWLLPREGAPELKKNQFLKLNVDDITKRITLVSDA